MSKQVINVGAAANDGTGDPLRTAFQKTQGNVDELYSFLGNGTDLGSGFTNPGIVFYNGTLLKTDAELTYNETTNKLTLSGDIATGGVVELGHASDTTLARIAAGRLSVEGVGVVRGPGSATDNRITRFDGTTGDLVQSSGIGVSDTDDVTGLGDTTPATDGAKDLGSATLQWDDIYFDNQLIRAGVNITPQRGTYTPTLTNVANLAASTAYEAQWLRVGDMITVSGKVDVDPTQTATVTQLGISLPVASNLGAQEDCAGMAFCPSISGMGAAILGDTVNDRAQMQWVASDITNQPMYFQFTFQVI